MDNGINIYVILNEQVNQYVVMVVDSNMPLWSEIVTGNVLQNRLTGLKETFGDTGRPVNVYSRY